MKFKFLGTGAADRIDLPQDSDFSQKDHRRCACALLENHIMLDCGPHALNSLEVAGIDLFSITDIIITHRHRDHFCLESINKIAACGGVRLWLREGSEITNCAAEITYMKPFSTYKIGGFSVSSVPANHDPNAFPQHLCIEDEKVGLFYALDGAWILNETVTYLKNREFNAMVIDATVGDYSGDFRIGEHNSIPMIRLMIDSMRTVKIINEQTKIYLSHIACCLHKSHEETCKIVAPDNLIVAYDGFEVAL